MDEKEIEYLQGLLKLPSVGARGINAIYEEVKKQGKAYDNKTKSGFTSAKIKQWYESREKVQTHKRGTGYHSYTSGNLDHWDKWDKLGWNRISQLYARTS